MCFTKLSIHQKAKTATKGIVCYKRLVYHKSSKTYDGPFYTGNYKIGNTYSIKRFSHRFHEIAEGFHAYIQLSRAKILKQPGESIGIFVIPKGTKYYDNGYEYVSKSIKFVSKLKK